MTGHCEECGGHGPLDENGLCASDGDWDAEQAAAAEQRKANALPPAVPYAQQYNSPAGSRCEECGGWSARVGEDGLCAGCAAADVQRANLAALTARAQEAAACARTNGSVPGRRCEECGDWSPAVGESGMCSACAAHGQAQANARTARREARP